MNSANWEQADPYERYVGRWSRQVAPLFLRWLDQPAGLRWVDVGCGTGALTTAILDTAEPASVYAVDPSAGFLESARARLGTRATLMQAGAEHLPLEDRSADVVVSALVLNFIADLPAALTEMRRVGSTVAGYVWDYGADMQFMRLFWDAAVAVDESAHDRDEAVRFPFATPDGLRDLFSDFSDVSTTALDIPTRFADFDALWSPFLGAQGSAPSYLASLEAEAQVRLREELRDRAPIAADGSIELVARAWAVRGSA